MAYISKDEFIQSFSNWIHYEYGYQSQRMHNILVIGQLKKEIADDDEFEYLVQFDNRRIHEKMEAILSTQAIVAI
jgi:hypothetical protein